MRILKIPKVLLFVGSLSMTTIYSGQNNCGVVNKQGEQVSSETKSKDGWTLLIDQMRG